MEFSEIALQFQEACRNVRAAIESSRFKASWFMTQLGFSRSPSAYYRRLADGNWTPEQLANIGQLLEGKEIGKG